LPHFGVSIFCLQDVLNARGARGQIFLLVHIEYYGRVPAGYRPLSHPKDVRACGEQVGCRSEPYFGDFAAEMWFNMTSQF